MATSAPRPGNEIALFGYEKFDSPLAENPLGFSRKDVADLQRIDIWDRLHNVGVMAIPREAGINPVVATDVLKAMLAKDWSEEPPDRRIFAVDFLGHLAANLGYDLSTKQEADRA